MSQMRQTSSANGGPQHLRNLVQQNCSRLYRLVGNMAAFIVGEGGDAFSLHEEDLLAFLEMRAAGGTACISKYGVGIGPFAFDLTALDRTTAFQLAAQVRVKLAQDEAA